MIFLVAAARLSWSWEWLADMRKPGGLSLQSRRGARLRFDRPLVALYVDPDLGGYLVAFALIGHAGWDAYHYLRNRVVAAFIRGVVCRCRPPAGGVAILLLLA